MRAHDGGLVGSAGDRDARRRGRSGRRAAHQRVSPAPAGSRVHRGTLARGTDRSGPAAPGHSRRGRRYFRKRTRDGVRWCSPSSWRSDRPWLNEPPLSRDAPAVCRRRGVLAASAPHLADRARDAHESPIRVWFFEAGDTLTASNTVGLVGAFTVGGVARSLGYAAYLVPMVLGIVQDGTSSGAGPWTPPIPRRRVPDCSSAASARSSRWSSAAPT